MGGCGDAANLIRSTNSVLVVVQSSQNHYNKAPGAWQQTWAFVSEAGGKQSLAVLGTKSMYLGLQLMDFCHMLDLEG